MRQSAAMPTHNLPDRRHDSFSGAMSAACENRDSAPLAMIPVHEYSDILPAYRGTALAGLLATHNLGLEPSMHERPELLVITCMDYRVTLDIPGYSAYVLRVAGANVEPVAFNVSFAVSVAGIKAIAVVGHDDCAMEGVASRRETFISGLRHRCHWTHDLAETHFDDGVERFAIRESEQATWQQAQRLRQQYTGVHIAPLFFRVGDGMLLQIVKNDALELESSQAP
jgi:carbonic anhydrase